jgi:hypothetical protein
MPSPATRCALAALLVLLPAGGAAASATLDCTISDAAVEASANAILAHGIPAPLSNVAGEITLKSAKGLPALPPKTAFEGEHLAHSWVLGRDLKLQFYREPEGDGVTALDLVIEVRQAGTDDETPYRGRYTLKASWVDKGEAKSKTFSGKAVCTAG